MGTSPGLPGVASLTSDRLKAVSPTAATTAQRRPKPREVTPSCQACSNVRAAEQLLEETHRRGGPVV